MVTDPLLIVCILVFGCAAFFLGLLYLIGQVFGFVGRGFGRLLGFGSARSIASDGGGLRATVCARATCGHLERRAAAYCSQCGAKMSR